MTFDELLAKLKVAGPDRDWSKTNLAHTFMITQPGVIESWKKNNKVPDAYVEHVEKMIVEVEIILRKY